MRAMIPFGILTRAPVHEPGPNHGHLAISYPTWRGMASCFSSGLHPEYDGMVVGHGSRE